MIRNSNSGLSLQTASSVMMRLLFALLSCCVISTSISSTNSTVSSVPDPNCILGSYRTTQLPFGACSGFRGCEIGTFCVDGIKSLCPAGYFGDTQRLHSSSCSGLCAAGYYCSAGSVTSYSTPCGGGDVYCPVGTGVPLLVPLGYYSTDTDNTDSIQTLKLRVSALICPFGYYCENGLKRPCSGGTYGQIQGLHSSECSGMCPEGKAAGN